MIRFRLPDGVGPAELPEGIGSAASRNGDLELTTSSPTEALHTLTGWALERRLELEGLEVNRPSLEDIYLELTGDAPEDDR